MLCCGVEREATLREPHLNANYWVQNLRHVVCELEQHSQVRKLNIVTNLRLESQLDQLERLEGDQQRIVIEYQFSACLHEREFVLGSTHVVVCDRGLDMYTAMRRGARRTRQCRILYSEVHGDFNAADRAANVPVPAPVAPPVRSQLGRPAPSTLEKMPERGLGQGVAHARVEPERVPKGHVAPRENEVKQQQDWRLVFVDRPETEQIIDCMDEFMTTRECFHKDLLSRSICVAACLLELSHEVHLRSVQAGPANLALERVPKAGNEDSVVRLAPRTNEVKQQQDRRLVFVDRPETYGITDRLDELMGENVGFGRDLMSRSICACLSGMSHEVPLRKVQTGPGLGMASLAQRIAEEEVSSDSECSRCPGDDQKCRCFDEGTQEINRMRERRRACRCSLQDGLRPICDVA